MRISVFARPLWESTREFGLGEKLVRSENKNIRKCSLEWQCFKRRSDIAFPFTETSLYKKNSNPEHFFAWRQSNPLKWGKVHQQRGRVRPLLLSISNDSSSAFRSPSWHMPRLASCSTMADLHLSQELIYSLLWKKSGTGTLHTWVLPAGELQSHRGTGLESLSFPGTGCSQATSPRDAQPCSPAAPLAAGVGTWANGCSAHTASACQTLQSTKWMLVVGMDTFCPFFRRYHSPDQLEGLVALHLKNVIWLGCHNLLHKAWLASETASDQHQTGNSLTKMGWSRFCQEHRNCSSSPSDSPAALWPLPAPGPRVPPANKHNLTHHSGGGYCGLPFLVGGRPWRTRLWHCNSC